MRKTENEEVNNIMLDFFIMQSSKHSCDRSDVASKGSGNCIKFAD